MDENIKIEKYDHPTWMKKLKLKNVIIQNG